MRQVAPAASIHWQEMNTGRGWFDPTLLGAGTFTPQHMRAVTTVATAFTVGARRGEETRCASRKSVPTAQNGADCGSLARTSGSRGGRRGSAAAAVARAPSGGTRSTCAGKGRPRSNRGGGRAVGIGVLSSALDECGLFGYAAHGSAKGGRCVRAPVEDLL